MDVQTVAHRNRLSQKVRSARRARFPGLGLMAGGAAALTAIASLVGGAPTTVGAAAPSFLGHLHHVSVVGSTVPSNGDVNPYGVANVPSSTGDLVRGDTLVSNFNASTNFQGTGTTIVQVAPDGQVGLFAQIDPMAQVPATCPGGIGLTTALSVLNDGYVVVGSLPVTAGGMGTPQPGCLLVLNSQGTPIETISGNGIDGPWDMTSLQVSGDSAELFVTNVLNGIGGDTTATDQGTVLRLSVFEPPDGGAPVFFDTTTIGTGFDEALNSNALVLGPTGVALGQDGTTLYVADTVNSRIADIPLATSRSTAEGFGGITISEGGSLNAPLGLITAPNGDLITVNGNDGNAVEVTPSGAQVDTMTIDPFNGGGDLFGLTIAPRGNGILFVDDNSSANTLDLLH